MPSSGKPRMEVRVRMAAPHNQADLGYLALMPLEDYCLQQRKCNNLSIFKKKTISESFAK